MSMDGDGQTGPVRRPKHFATRPPALLGALLLAMSGLPLAAAERPSPKAFPHPFPEVAAASPLNYPDEDGFQARAQVILEGLASADLGTWRRGYFSGGDPGKYLPGHAMARRLRNPQDPEPARYMNDDRSPREHYHFAAVNWARYLPLFGDTLTPETRTRLAAEAGKYGAYLQPGGTENHKVMWWTSANVLPLYLEGEGRLSNRPRAEALAVAKGILKAYVKGLFLAGQGEWDSSTYLTFDLNGMLNIHDFSQDPECRLLARAALDWYAATYALKYRDGLFCGPNQRGFAERPYQSLTDQTGYLWWGGNRQLQAADAKDFRYTLHAITSAYRPNAVITNLARKRIAPLPADQRNSKPNYWHGQNLPPMPGRYRETLHLGRTFTLGTLWNGHGSQITRFQLAVETPGGSVAFTGGSPRRSDHNGVKTDFGYADGIGRHDQMVQAGPVQITMSRIPEGEPLAYAFFAFPPSCPPLPGLADGGWFVFAAGQAFVGVLPFGGPAEVGVTDLNDKEKAENAKNAARGRPPFAVPRPIIRIAGRNVGFVVQVAEQPEFADVAAFAKALGRTTLDTSSFASQGTVTYRSLAGQGLAMTFSPDAAGDRHGDRLAAATLDGNPLQPASWPIYDGPFLSQQDGIFRVSDGKRAFTIDFSGDLPVYREEAGGER